MKDSDNVMQFAGLIQLIVLDAVRGFAISIDLASHWLIHSASNLRFRSLCISLEAH